MCVCVRAKWVQRPLGLFCSPDCRELGVEEGEGVANGAQRVENDFHIAAKSCLVIARKGCEMQQEGGRSLCAYAAIANVNDESCYHLSRTF